MTKTQLGLLTLFGGAALASGFLAPAVVFWLAMGAVALVLLWILGSAARVRLRWPVYRPGVEPRRHSEPLTEKQRRDALRERLRSAAQHGDELAGVPPYLTRASWNSIADYIEDALGVEVADEVIRGISSAIERSEALRRLVRNLDSYDLRPDYKP